MKLTIFTGITETGKRFFDSYTDDCGFCDEYDGDDRHDFYLTEQEIAECSEMKAGDFETFKDCLRGLSKDDSARFMQKAYLGDIDRELINDQIQSVLRKIVVDKWVTDCLIEVKRKYTGE